MGVCRLDDVGRRRILLDVQPRVLRDALGEVLDSVGLDEVLVSEEEPADRSTMSYDAAIVSSTALDVDADVVIELDLTGMDTTGHVRTATAVEVIDLRTPDQLLTLLDRLCPTTAARTTPFGGLHG